MTKLKCADWKCSNWKSEVNAYVDKRDYKDKQENRPPRKPELGDLRCAVHAAGLKRSRYRDDPIPLNDKDRTRLLKEQAAVDEEERKEQEKARIANDEREARNHAKEWEEVGLRVYHDIVADPDRDDEPTFEGQVWMAGHRSDRGFEDRWFSIQPSHRYYGTPPEGARLYPYVLHIMRGADMTPNEARALAAALIAGADKAEELNKERAPRVNEEVPA